MIKALTVGWQLKDTDPHEQVLEKCVLGLGST